MAKLIRKITQFSPSEIDSLWKQARRVVRHAGLHLLKAPRSGSLGRILMVIPKRIGDAPTRNKLRRQLRHIFYENKLFNGDSDWIVIARPGADKITFATLQDLFLQAAQKTG
jgi:ribonuclease P protein component